MEAGRKKGGQLGGHRGSPGERVAAETGMVVVGMDRVSKFGKPFRRDTDSLCSDGVWGTE